MKKFTHHIFLLLGVLAVCQLNSKLLAQEGTKQFIQSIDNNGEEDTMCIALMNGNDTDPTLHTYGSPPKGRMYFGFKNGENAYMGANAKFKDFPNNTVNFRVRGPIVGNPLTASAAAIVFGPQPTPGEVFSNFGEGYIANPSQAIIGAQEVNGPGGYDGILILDSTKATGIYYIEFDNASNDLAQLSYFDLSIKKANGQPASGRLFSYAWSLYNKLEGFGFKVSDLDFFVYHTKDSTVTELNWDNVEPGGFSLQVNESGPLDINPLSPTLSEDRIIARQSTPYAVVSSNAVNPMFPVFFTVPDTSFFPLATTAPDIIVDSVDRFCPFTDSFKFILTKESLVDVFLDLDGNDKVYTPNTADVLLIAGRSPAGPLATLWNGNDGNNNIVPLSQSVNIIFNVIAGEIHLPLGDFEENPLGFNGSVISPAFAQSSFLKIYHDDTQFPSSSENLQPLNLAGCITNSCHIWGNGGANNSSYGNARWINTWWTSYEKQIEFSFQKICLTADPDFNATWVNVPVEGDVSTNDENWPIGTTYGTPTAIPGNPDGSTPALSPDGTYTFISPVPGVFKFLVPVCAPGVVVPNCDETLLTITVLDPNESTNPPVANVDIATTPLNTPVTLNTLANDKAGNVGNILVPSTVAIVDSPNNGTITVDPVSGNTTYTPNSGFIGKDTLEYTVCDNQVPAKCATAFQIITIEAANATNSTVAADDYETTPYNTPVSGNAMLNDSDPQGQPQTITPQTTTIPGKGTLVLDATGTFTFTPVQGFSGPVEFPYTTCDNGSPIACANATIHILIDPPLVADPDFNATWVNVPVEGDVSTNDENWPIGTTYGTPTAIPGNPDGSTPALSPDGTYTFISPVPGVFKFLVPVCAPGVVVPNCDETLLTITVLEPNQSTNPPVANVDIATTPLNTPVTLNTLANDKAGNVGNILVPSTVAIVDSPNNGTITVDPVSGNTTYTPNSGFIGKDTLEYTVCDNQVPAKCATAFQIITIEAANATNSTVAADDYETTPYNTPVSGNAMLNDSDPQGQPQTITPQTTTIPGKGTLVLDATGTFTFTPVQGFSGPVEFPYTTCDNGSPIACANATIHILVPLPPVIVPIMMNYFTINSTHCEVKINWGTQLEVNTSHFNILRKSSKETAFISIAKLNAAGNSETQKDYAYTDTDLRKDQYEYKIETVDIDQSNSISDIRSVNALCVHQNISVYPNPVTENTNVKISSEDILEYTITVTDITGRILVKSSTIVDQGSKIVVIPTTTFATGIYKVNVISEKGIQTFKIQKTK